MIPLSLQIVVALFVDALCGDPRWFPHPVKGIGWLALTLETPLRQLLPPRQAGISVVVIVITTTTYLVWGVCSVASLIHPLLGDLVQVFILYTCFAGRDLRHHALKVYHPLVAGDLVLARQQVAQLVGRDIDKLDEGEITRATVESVAENSVDGITAPLIFAFLAGAPGAIFYKAVNTLDSTFGYTSERYLQFGWAAAKFDDLVNFIPARISAVLTPLAAWLIGLAGRRAWQIFLRDRRNHPSPNGGQIEAAFAGALGVQLGGLNHYAGVESNRPLMGDAQQPLTAQHIKQALRLMMVLVVLITFCGIVGRVLAGYLITFFG